jgi:4-diphosphocytidyl-2-C-methyl-D-erythritol kinase
VKLVEDAPGKVNLCLYLGPTRADGRHELVTVYESVSLADELTLTLADSDDVVVCHGVEGPNLVADALAALRSRGWQAPPVAVSIEKRIPVAAGMGGGSADAAAALRLAARLGVADPRARIDAGVLIEIARELGSDVPAQLAPGLSLGIGAGEVVEQLAPLADHALAIVPLDHALSTPDVYREADRLELPRASDDLAFKLTEVTGWMRRGARPPARLLVNDLEAAARSLCPAIDDALDELRAEGPDVVFVSGSGPTCAGLWWGERAVWLAEESVRSLRTDYPRSVAVTPAITSIRHNSPTDD